MIPAAKLTHALQGNFWLICSVPHMVNSKSQSKEKDLFLTEL